MLSESDFLMAGLNRSITLLLEISQNQVPTSLECTMSSATPLSTYSIHLSIPINAAMKAVWKAITRDINEWWPSSFFSHPEAQAFVMECQVGGRVYEDWGKKAGGEWGRLIVFQPCEKLVWVGNHFGNKGKNWGNFFVTIQLKESNDGVVLEFEDSGFGMLDEGMPASLESGWQELYGTHLKNYIEAKASKKKGGKKK